MEHPELKLRFLCLASVLIPRKSVFALSLLKHRFEEGYDISRELIIALTGQYINTVHSLYFI